MFIASNRRNPFAQGVTRLSRKNPSIEQPDRECSALRRRLGCRAANDQVRTHPNRRRGMVGEIAIEPIEDQLCRATADLLRPLPHGGERRPQRRREIEIGKTHHRQIFAESQSQLRRRFVDVKALRDRSRRTRPSGRGSWCRISSSDLRAVGAPGIEPPALDLDIGATRPGLASNDSRRRTAHACQAVSRDDKHAMFRCPSDSKCCATAFAQRCSSVSIESAIWSRNTRDRSRPPARGVREARGKCS